PRTLPPDPFRMGGGKGGLYPERKTLGAGHGALDPRGKNEKAPGRKIAPGAGKSKGDQVLMGFLPHGNRGHRRLHVRNRQLGNRPFRGGSCQQSGPSQGLVEFPEITLHGNRGGSSPSAG